MTWLIDWIPWWLWGVGAIVALTATSSLWLPLWAWTPNWIKIALGAMGGAILIYLKGRSDKGADQKLADAKRDADAQRVRTGIDNEVRNKPKPDLDREHNRWLRD